MFQIPFDKKRTCFKAKKMRKNMAVLPHGVF